MRLQEYFAGQSGVGVISTANNKGEVNSAVYAKPHVTGKNSIAFVTRDKLTRANLQENVKANYLFIEKEGDFKGIRLYLTMTEEVQDKELIASLSRRTSANEDDSIERFLIYFNVEKALALIGDEAFELE
ncbi:pyridoxamine 5'-phosphate oxidase family protein [Desulfotalea psychrophila]|uniref:Uncharacterized protein n=1 Tax=Desulfotalea psychrophila (strain LSv54 / DSM 12343) TaxID=177439 RepID=Q6AL94_DESPS|nr:pyridoxamine 5'-phosphate oxidase family protein [Desulfotalea psychrophila]CAG36881.1 conserved hypothetical protein [Desulfotalea psychrophila LSv54]